MSRNHNAPESANLTAEERAEVEVGRTAMATLAKTFDVWVSVGRAIKTLRERARLLGGRKAFQRLLDQQGFGADQLDKATVSRLLKIMDALAEVTAWHESLTDKQRRDWSSPSAVHKHC